MLHQKTGGGALATAPPPIHLLLHGHAVVPGLVRVRELLLDKIGFQKFADRNAKITIQRPD